MEGLRGGVRRAAEVHRQPAPILAFGSRDQMVLVVEDEARVRGIAVATPRRLGHSAVYADSAIAALRQLDEYPNVAMLFTDVVMPDVNGRKLAEQAVRRRPGLKVLFTTGYTRDAVAHCGILDPDVQLLPEPFSL